jgi:hypothetical protein
MQIILNVGHYIDVPNIVVEWLTLLRIREVPGSSLSPETDYPSFLGFSQSFHAIAGIVP